MADNKKYRYPVKRIGNENNPKLLILLSNPGGSAEFYKRLPEYTMDKDILYKDAGMDMHKYREYCKWWNDVLTASDEHVKDTDVLALEYYPYHTVGSGDIPKYSDWDDYAKNALEENINLLEKCLTNGIPVFGYYWGAWLRHIPNLKNYSNFHKSKNTQGQINKIKELAKFLGDKK